MTEYGHKYETLPTDVDIKTIMDTWTLQPGYPVVTVIRNNSDVTITQQRYQLPETDYSDNSRWYVPITFETTAKRHQEGVPSYWLNLLDNITITDVADPADWLYVNIERKGFYRVNYDYESWLILSRFFDDLPAVAQAQLIDDSLQLARAELLSYDVTLTFLMRLVGKYDSTLPWAAAGQGITYLRNMLNREAAYEHFRVSWVYNY